MGGLYYSFDPQEYIKMMRSAISTAFLYVYSDYDELESILSINNIVIKEDETPI